MVIIDLTGKRFERLLVLSECKERIKNQVLWKCQCDCGTIKDIRGGDLRSGKTISCGCLRDEIASMCNGVHMDNRKGKRARLYTVWSGIKSRCNSMKPNSPDYKYYKGKGVSICGEWDQYVNFKRWATCNGYSDDLVIDRINPDKGYSPENCRWITARENARRCSFAKLDMDKAEVIRRLHGSVPAKELSYIYNVSPGTIRKVWNGDLWY